MGYRSEVHIGVAFSNEADLKEVLAVYAINPQVQKYNLLKEWERKEDNILYYHGDYVKWYESYEDVQGTEHMLALADTFKEERDMPIAYRFVRVGEGTEDIEERDDSDDDGVLIEKLWDSIRVTVKVEVEL